MKQFKCFRSVIAIALVVMMVVGMLPMSALAGQVTLATGMTRIQEVETELAPGITQNELVVLDKNGKQVELFIATADLNVETVGVQSSYVGAQCVNHGMAKMTEQVAAAEAKYEARGEQYTAVVAMNGSYYNMTTGQPTGTFFMEGVNGNGSAVNNYPFFGVLKDGTPIIGRAGEYNTYVDQLWEAVGGHTLLVWDGVNQMNAADTTKYPRSAVGVTADNKVVFINANGNQAPKSVGLTLHELADLFVNMGCVAAVRMDEGGSATYCTKPQGSDTIEVTSTPSDGAERPVSTGIIIYSTAKGDGEFDSAVLTAEHEYVTPESSVNVSAVGADVVGGAAEIPAEVTWQLADSSMGTVENGVFTSNGTVGDAVIQMVYDGEVVGETTVHVVIPDIAFSQETMLVPYDKEFELPVLATVNGGVNEVVLKDGDIVYTMSDSALGTITGNWIKVCGESSGITGGTITATCKYDAAKTDSVTITFGKASEIVYDFEDFTLGDFGKTQTSADYQTYVDETGTLTTAQIKNITRAWGINSTYLDRRYDIPTKGDNKAGRLERGSLEIVDASTGRVRNGSQALAVNCDFTYSTGAGGRGLNVHIPSIDLTGATSVGMWMYIGVADMRSVRLNFTSGSDMSATAGITKYAFNTIGNSTSGIYEDGWYYVSVNMADNTSVTKLERIEISVNDSNNAMWNPMNKFTVYIDDITVDYSSATDDREIPTFTGAYISKTADDKTALNGQIIDQNTVSLSAVATETLTGNYTGLDVNSAKLYIDGVQYNGEVTCSANGNVLAENVTLSDGIHSIRFEISDLAGNVGFITRQLVVNKTAGAVSFVPADPDATLVPMGSIQWFNLVAENIETVDTITSVINLDGNNTWELEGMEVAYGFEASYSVDANNDATVTITRVGEPEVSGNAVIASLPVRVWENRSYTDEEFLSLGLVSNNPGSVDGGWVMTPHGMWYSDGVRLMRIELQVEKGHVTFVDDTTDTFGSESIKVMTELNRYRRAGHYLPDGTWVAVVKGATTSEDSDMQGKWSHHIHVAGTAQDKAATCTEAGYTGRIFCVECLCDDSQFDWSANGTTVACSHDACGSVIDWGTVIPATGHSYSVVDGVLKCACGKLFNGEYTDGKTYVDGVVIGDGWNADNTKYFVGGVAITGTHIMDNTVYIFGEDGVYDEAASTSYLGFVEDGDDLYYAQLGKLVSGWFVDENGDYYYMQPDTYAAYEDGFLTVDGKTYEFADKILIDGHWVRGTDTFLYWAGDKVANGWKTIKGNTYYFWYGFASTGVCEIHLTYNSVETDWYLFDDYGVLQCKLDGLYGDYIYDNGQRLMAYQLVEVDGDYYFISTDNKIAKNQTAYLYDAFINGATYSDGTAMTAGYYEFGPDGKMIMKQGPLGDYFYVNGVRQDAYNVFEHNGDYYFVSDENKLAKNTTVYLYNVFLNGATYADGTAMTAGYYTFDAEGKMVINDGPVGDYFYISGVRQNAYKVYEYNGDYYFVSNENRLAKNTTEYLYNVFLNGATYEDGTAMTAGYYAFDADGKMILNDGPVNGYFYKNGVRQNAYKVFEYNGDYYFVSDENRLAKNTTVYLYNVFLNGATYADGTAMTAGYYTFDAEGKMVINDGPVGNYFYINGVRQNAYKVYAYNGAYYFVGDENQLAKNETVYLYNVFLNGATYEDGTAMTAGFYTFDADGKMIVMDGPVGDYFYKNGVRQNAYQLVEYKGDFYFIGDENKLAKNTQLYLNTYYTNGMTMPNGGRFYEGYYTFDADGKIVF